MKILTICPSKRPHALIHMMDSFVTTSSKYTNIVVNYEIRPITEIFNKVFNEHPDEDYYMMLNDDIFFKTPLWDLELAQKGKISYGDDCLQHENLPTFPMIDGNIVRALGWLQLPTLEKYCGDVCWRTIGKSLNILRYCPNVQIDHSWAGCENTEIHTKDMAAFAKWLQVSERDINKVRKVLNGIS